MTKRMFRKGEAYTSIEEFITDWQDLDGSRYVYWAHKLMHVNFAGAMRLSGLATQIGRGGLFRAIRNEVTE